MDEREYSRLLVIPDSDVTSETGWLIGLLFSDLDESGLIKNSPKESLKKHLKVVIDNLYLAYLDDPEIYIACELDKNAYRPLGRLGQLSLGYGPMSRVFAGLEVLGYLEVHKGFRDRVRGIGRISRIRLLERLSELFDEIPLATLTVMVSDHDVLILRDADKAPLIFEDTDQTRRMRDTLESYNVFLRRHVLGLSLHTDEIRALLIAHRRPALDYQRNRLHRVFSEDFESGGRFYNGWWQGMPSALRAHITIDGQSTSELDYRGQHLLLLYALKDHEFPWLKGNVDPYMVDIEGVDRPLMKEVFLISVNAESRQKAIEAIRKEINFNYPNLTGTDVLINSLIDATVASHSVLADCFFTRMWAVLQFRDSQIAEYVLIDLKAKGVLALPVHDSFVVQDECIHHLYASMMEAYRMLGIDSIPEVKLKAGANSDLSQPSFQMLGELILQQQKSQNQELAGFRELVDRFSQN